mmetsp:Transcript_8116/g.50218  ORF Transcript_8116/g.50218 Transcript_8116/m.50218 type:complete len:209 (+) Transcript_8116:2312-2938(+)
MVKPRACRSCSFASSHASPYKSSSWILQKPKLASSTLRIPADRTSRELSRNADPSTAPCAIPELWQNCKASSAPRITFLRYLATCEYSTLTSTGGQKNRGCSAWTFFRYLCTNPRSVCTPCHRRTSQVLGSPSSISILCASKYPSSGATGGSFRPACTDSVSSNWNADPNLSFIFSYAFTSLAARSLACGSTSFNITSTSERYGVRGA